MITMYLNLTIKLGSLIIICFLITYYYNITQNIFCRTTVMYIPAISCSDMDPIMCDISRYMLHAHLQIQCNITLLLPIENQ